MFLCNEKVKEVDIAKSEKSWIIYSKNIEILT